MKICGKCKEKKDVCEFGVAKTTKDKLRTICKECRKIEGQVYREKNSLLISEYHKKNYKNKKTEILERNKNWLSNNKEKKREIDKKYREENKELIKNGYENFHKKNPLIKLEYQKKYYKNNREKIFNYVYERRKNDLLFKLKDNVRCRLRVFLNSRNISKKNKTFDILGCSPEFLKKHIEKQFTEGMSWELMGEHIHIDHIIPLSSAKTEEEIYKLCHYTNLQPLWAKDNMKKSNKIL